MARLMAKMVIFKGDWTFLVREILKVNAMEQ